MERWPMFKIEGDRRRHPRLELERPCKLFDPRSEKYLAATTCNLSTHGVLINLPRLSALKSGDRVHVGVAMTRRQGLLPAKEMIEAEVVRTMQTVDDHTMLAVRFVAEQGNAVQQNAAVPTDHNMAMREAA